MKYQIKLLKMRSVFLKLFAFGLLVCSSPAVAATYTYDFSAREAIIGTFAGIMSKPNAVNSARIGENLNTYCSFNVGGKSVPGTYVTLELIIDGKGVKKDEVQVNGGGAMLQTVHTFNTAGTHKLTCNIFPQKGLLDTNTGNNSKTVSVNVVNTTTFKVSTSVSDPAGGSISPSAPQTVNSGGSTSFTVTINPGYAHNAVGCDVKQTGGYGVTNMTSSHTAIYTTGPITADCTVKANFYRLFNFSVAKTGSGSGTVIGPYFLGNAIDCGTRCSNLIQTGSRITLTATPASGSTFEGWSGGGCSGTGTCTVTINADTTVTAKFNAN